MTRNVQKGSGFSILQWLSRSATVLLLISSGLSLFVRLTLRQLDVTTVFAMLALAAWSFVLGIVVLTLLSAWLIASAVRHGSITFLSVDTPLQSQEAIGSKSQISPISDCPGSECFERRSIGT